MQEMKRSESKPSSSIEIQSKVKTNSNKETHTHNKKKTISIMETFDALTSTHKQHLRMVKILTLQKTIYIHGVD